MLKLTVSNAIGGVNRMTCVGRVPGAGETRLTLGPRAGGARNKSHQCKSVGGVVAILDGIQPLCLIPADMWHRGVNVKCHAGVASVQGKVKGHVRLAADQRAS